MPDNGRHNERLDRVEAILETLAQRQAELGQRQAEFAEGLSELKGVTQVLVTTQADLEEEHRRFLRAQVVMLDAVRQLADRGSELDVSIKGLTDAQRRTDESLNALAEAGRHTDERLNALIAVVDGMVRRPPPPPA